MQKEKQLTAYIIKFVKKNAPSKYYIGSSKDVKFRLDGYKNDYGRPYFMVECKKLGYSWSEEDIKIINI